MANEESGEILDKLTKNSNNPRVINDKAFKRLKNKIRDFPEMLEKRPIVYDEDYIILGGNRRFDALNDLKKEGFEVKSSYFVKAEDWSEDKKRKFVILDNLSDGEWDFDLLANQWGDLPLKEWGFNVGDWNTDVEKYSKKIKPPIYEPSEEAKPEISDLYNDIKVKELVDNILGADLPQEVQAFLVLAAQRHRVFDYAKIADFYAKSEKHIQELMEQSALVIIDFKKAYENGYLNLSEKVAKQYEDEY